MSVTAIDTFESIKGGINRQCKDVYFVRAVGTGPTYIQDIQKMDDTLDGCSQSGRGYYRRLGSLPKLQNPEDTAFYAECYAKWTESGRKEAVTRTTKDCGELAKLLGSACSAAEDICMREEMRMTDSIRKNFIVKLLFWYDAVFDKEEFVWDERESIKIVAENIVKKQEYLFFYLLTLTGCDVLLLQSRADIGADEEKLGLSVKFVLGDYSELAIPEYRRKQKQTMQENTQRNKQGYASGSGSAEPEKKEQKRQDRPVVVTIPCHPDRPGHANPANAPVRSAQPHGPVRQTPPVPSSHGAENGSAEKSFEELARLASSVVMIAIHDAKGDVIGTGSGIMVGRDGYILTNNHVASGGKFYSVRIEDDEQVYDTDEVIKYNYVLDLAVIRIQRKLVPLSIYQGKNKLVRGQKVVAIGSPLGLFNSVSDGIISGFRKIDNVDMIQFTAPTSHGSSGGAVLNMQGEVIGISTAGYDAGQNINLAMGYECINAFIRGFT